MNGFQYRKQIEIDRTRFVSRQEDYVLKVYIVGDADLLAHAKADGGDIRFTLADKTTEIPFNIISFGGGILRADVRVDIDSDMYDLWNKVIWLYYGNPNANLYAYGDPYGAGNVYVGTTLDINVAEDVSIVDIGIMTDDLVLFGYDAVGVDEGVLLPHMNEYVLHDEKRDLVIIDLMEYATDVDTQQAWVASEQTELDDYDVLFLQFEGTDGDTDTIDLTGNHTSISFNQGADISSDQVKFGNTCADVRGAKNVSITVNSDFDFGSGDFTIEFWVYIETLGGNGDLLTIEKSGGNAVIIRESGGNIVFAWGDGSGWHWNFSSSTPLTTNTWHHISWCRSGNTNYRFVDGEQPTFGGGGTFTGSIDTPSGNLIICAENTSGLNGSNSYIDEFRISKGVARYTSSFTPPTSPYRTETSPVVSSEDTIKTEGDYSLKAVFPATGTPSITKDVSLDLSDMTDIEFTVRASEVGTNLKFSLLNGVAEDENIAHEINIAVADEFQTEKVHIEAIANSLKNDVRKAVFEKISGSTDYYIDELVANNSKVIVDDFEYASDEALQAVWETSSANITIATDSTIEQQGSYCIKLSADTSSEGETVTKIFSAPLDFSGKDYIYGFVRASRAGKNFQLFFDNGETYLDWIPGTVFLSHFTGADGQAGGTDTLSGGTPSASSEYNPSYAALAACDNNWSSRWNADNSGFPQWWKYDYGSGTEKIIRAVKVYALDDPSGSAIKDFVVQGSNDDASWDDLGTFQYTNRAISEIFYFPSNSTEYRYYRIYISSSWRGNILSVFEFEMFEVFVDETEKAILFVGNAQIDTGDYKFSPSSLLLDGTGDYVYTEQTNDFTLGDNSFTFDCWIKTSVPSTTQQIFMLGHSGTYKPLSLAIVSGKLVLKGSTSGTDWEISETGSIEVAANEWAHIAVVRNESKFYVTLSGEKDIEATNSGNLVSGDRGLYVGASDSPGDYFNGRIDEFRIVNGRAIYEEEFTPPTTPYAQDYEVQTYSRNYLDVTISEVDTWSEKGFVISNIADSDKNTIIAFGVRILNDDSSNEIYLDLIDARYVGVVDIDLPEVFDESATTEDVGLELEPALDIGVSGSLYTAVTTTENVVAGKSQPVKPTNTDPTHQEINQDLQVVLAGDAYSHPYSVAHDRSRWQVSDVSGDYSNPVYDSGWVASAPTSVQVPSSTLLPETEYYWRMSYRDVEMAWSEWSTETSFTTKTLLVGGKVTLNDVGVSGAKIYCIKQSTSEVIDTEVSDVSGDYAFHPLEEGELYHVTVEYENEGVQYNALNRWDVVPFETDVPA